MINEKILLISDDENKELFYKFEDIINENDSIELVYSKSDVEDFKEHMRRDFYIIFIDYDNLNMDVNDLVKQIRNYLYSLPLIIVASEDVSVFDRKKIPKVYFLNKSTKGDLIYNKMVNYINVMKFNKSMNDLSHLPGNFVINELLNSKIENNSDFLIMYIGIDKFKSFVDYYGLVRANKVIRYLTDKILELVDEYGSTGDFVGHVGGDGFVVICNSFKNARRIVRELVNDFDSNVRNFYDAEDLENNYISLLSHNGTMEKFPLISVSIISISNEYKDYSSTKEIINEMEIIKKESRRTSGSILLESN